MRLASLSITGRARGGILALGLSIFCCTGLAGPGAPRFELLHFWSSSAEREALKVISDEFRRRHNVEWIERVPASSDAAREIALQRIIQGYPPDVIQWHPSSEVWSLYDMQVTRSLTALAHRRNLGEKLPDIVLGTVVVAGEYVALPTNVHGENFIWYSAPVYKKLELSYPETWEQLLDQARRIGETGIPAVAMGEGDWEKRVLFLTILNALNTQTYTALLSSGRPAVAARPEVLRAYEIMAALREASQSGRTPAGWTGAADLVARGRAGMQFMGDWVNNELKSQGYKLDTHYTCRLPPGADPAFMVLVDGFIFPVTEKHESLQQAFAEVVLDPEIQVEFALKKSALPIFKDLSDKRFDECARIGLRALRGEIAVVSSPAMYTSRNFGVIVQSIAAELWNTGMSPPQAREMLREELEMSRELETKR